MNKKIGDMTETKLKDFIIELQEENGRYERKNRKLKTDIKFFKAKINELEDNRNELKEIIKKKFVAQGGFTSYEWNDLLNELLDKMQELERGVSDEND